MINKTFILNWNINGDDEEFSEYAYDRIGVVTYDLNKIFNKTGIKFISKIEFFNKYKGYKISDTTNCKQNEKCISFYNLLINLRGIDWKKKGSFQIIVCDFKNEDLNGFAFFPWDFMLHGAIAFSKDVIHSDSMTIPHEIGHAFGLYHVFRGIDEVQYLNNVCDNCYEKEPNNYSGDFCDDTDPIPIYWECDEPDIKQNPDKCFLERKKWNTKSLNNIMGYTSCREEFTEQQLKRMKCWQEQFKNKYFK